MTRRLQVVASIIGVFIIALAGAAAYFATRSQVGAEPILSRSIATISLSPVNLSLKAGESAALDLVVDPGNGKATLVNLKLIFDSKIIKVDSFSGKVAFKDLVQTVIDNETGKVVIRVASSKGFEGQQIIGSLRIIGQSAGSAKIVADDEVSPSVVVDGNVRVPIFVGATVVVR